MYHYLQLISVEIMVPLKGLYNSKSIYLTGYI